MNKWCDLLFYDFWLFRQPFWLHWILVAAFRVFDLWSLQRAGSLAVPCELLVEACGVAKRLNRFQGLYGLFVFKCIYTIKVFSSGVMWNRFSLAPPPFTPKFYSFEMLLFELSFSSHVDLIFWIHKKKCFIIVNFTIFIIIFKSLFKIFKAIFFLVYF